MTARRSPQGGGALLGLLLAAACAPAGDGHRAPAAVTAAIVSGTADSQDPAVVGIGTRRLDCDARLAVHCSGTLIAPRLVLTAAHCALGPSSAGTLEVLFGSDSADPAAVLRRVAEVQVHPDYRADGDPADLALLLLADSAPVAPVALNSTALDGSAVGQSVRLVGFGQTRPTGEPPGQKRTGTATLSVVQSTQLRIVPGPSLSCHGDSGGPLLSSASGSELLIGVITTGDPGCAAYGLNVRVDAFLRDFILPGVARAQAAPPPPTDGPLAGAPLCAAACARDADCPAGLVCQVGPTDQGLAPRCLIPGLLAGALAEACTGQGQCAERCVRVRADEGPAACRCYSACATEPPAPAQSGCQATPGSGPARFPGCLAILLALLFFFWRGFRRHNIACLGESVSLMLLCTIIVFGSTPKKGRSDL